MTNVLNKDQLFNETARTADLETPTDRFHDLIVAAFRSNVTEAYKLHLEHPHREPDAGLVQNAAAWIQDLMMPDMTQQDIARRISGWIIKEAKRESRQKHCAIEQPKQQHAGLLPFM